MKSFMVSLPLFFQDGFSHATSSNDAPLQSSEIRMSPYRSGISDILITVVTVLTQVLIARRFFSER